MKTRRITGDPPPLWVMLLAAKVCADEGRRVPRIQWWRSSRSSSSGHCKAGVDIIHISAGTDPQDLQLTVMHELAHHLTRSRKRKSGRGSWHNKRFYTKAFELYRRYGDAEFVAYCAKREAEYMKRSASISGHGIPQ